MEKSRSSGYHKSSYTPSLQEGNPIVTSSDKDWWSEMCSKYSEKNYFKVKKKKEKEEVENTEKNPNNKQTNK